MKDEMLDVLLNHSTGQLAAITQKVKSAERISDADALYLYREAPLAAVGVLANTIRERLNGDRTYFNRNYHIEPTNVCVFSCKFCSYSREYKHREAGWELSMEEMLDKVRSYPEGAVPEVHIVGGVHPKMDLEFFASLLREIRILRPGLHIKAFTAVELDYMFRKAKKTIAEGLAYLKENGLMSLPGGGAEIFDEDIRHEIAGDKCSSATWLEIHATAHRLGMHSNATMLYGHYEQYEHRVDHLRRLRELQDDTRGFNTFIPLKFRNKDNEMSHLTESTLSEDLRNYAVSRIYLDNFNHIKAYWPMIGRSTAQMSQAFGVDDLDGTIDDSTRIYTMAGSEEQNPTLTSSELAALIRSGGRVPVERDTLYQNLKEYEESSLSS